MERWTGISVWSQTWPSSSVYLSRQRQHCVVLSCTVRVAVCDVCHGPTCCLFIDVMWRYGLIMSPSWSQEVYWSGLYSSYHGCSRAQRDVIACFNALKPMIYWGFAIYWVPDWRRRCVKASSRRGLCRWGAFLGRKVVCWTVPKHYCDI